MYQNKTIYRFFSLNFSFYIFSSYIFILKLYRATFLKVEKFFFAIRAQIRALFHTCSILSSSLKPKSSRTESGSTGSLGTTPSSSSSSSLRCEFFPASWAFLAFCKNRWTAFFLLFFSVFLIDRFFFLLRFLFRMCDDLNDTRFECRRLPNFCCCCCCRSVVLRVNACLLFATIIIACKLDYGIPAICHGTNSRIKLSFFSFLDSNSAGRRKKLLVCTRTNITKRRSFLIRRVNFNGRSRLVIEINAILL